MSRARAMLAFVLALGVFATGESAAAPSAIDLAGVQDGDVVLRHAHGRWSKYFRDASPVDRRFSHIGIITLDAAGSR